MHVPAAVIAVPLLMGATIGIWLAEASPNQLSVCAAGGSLLALAAAASSFAHGDARETTVAIIAGALLSGVSLGAAGAQRAYEFQRVGFARAVDEPVAVEGTLKEDAAPSQFGASLTVRGVRIGTNPVAGGSVRLSIGGASAAAQVGQWRAGRRVRLFATLRQPATYRNFGAGDEAPALARRGLLFVGSVKSAALVEVVSGGSRLHEAAAAARAWTRLQVHHYIGRWSMRSSAIVSAILIGDRTGLSDEDERRLQQAGTYHVIAISGGNIAILTALLLAVLRAARVPPRTSAAVVIGALLFYSQIAGAAASVARAVTAAVVFLAARLLDHRGPALNALSVAAVCAIAVSPLATFDPGFILSFGATAGILLGAPRLMDWFGARRDHPAHVAYRLVVAIVSLLVATICAEIALAPVGAALFSRITFAGLLLNFAAIPLMTVVQAAALAMLPAAPIVPQVAQAAGYVAHVASVGLVESSRLVEVAPWLSRDVTPPAWWVMAVYYAACGLVLFLRRARRVAALVIAAAGVLMIVSPAAGTRRAPPHGVAGVLRVVFLDVGQGDATLVLLPNSHALLIDAGGLPGSTFDIGERVVTPALRAFGVRRLETLVITHGDPDHIGGALAVMRHFHPRVVWEGVPVPPHRGLRALNAFGAPRNVAWRTVQAGDTERSAGVDVRVAHPPPPDWERQRVRNDDSVVLELRLGEVSIVLPGDIGREGERAVLSQISPGRIVVLKAPHHGSATSSTPELVAALHPAAVVFSAGRRNPFGHPAPAVLVRYRAAGSAIFRTDEDGAVLIETDGTKVDIRTFTGRHLTLSR